jgi:hypothetical protein
MRYEYLDLPCLNKSFVCTHGEFVKDYKLLYPDIKYDIPQEVLSKFGDIAEASSRCILIFMHPISTVSDAAWLCHPNLLMVFNLQVKLSKVIFAQNTKSYTFVATYIQNQATKFEGQLKLKKGKFMQFIDFQKKVILKADFEELEPYATALYSKEPIIWKGSGQAPEYERCLKIIRKTEIKTNNPDYFCVYYEQNDYSMKMKLELTQAKFQAELYTNKINIRLQKAALNLSRNTLSQLKQNTLEVDSKVLFPIKVQVRSDYFTARHELANEKANNPSITDEEYGKKLEDKKQEVINNVCGPIEICKKAIEFAIASGLLPLKGTREIYAMNTQNPYNMLMPKVNIQIKLPAQDSPGRKQVEAVAIMKGVQDFFASLIPESSEGDVPNTTSIRKALNTIKSLRDKNTYKKIEEIQKSCKIDERNLTDNVRRKISLLMFSADLDIFFEYFTLIRDTLVGKPTQ